MHSLAVVKGSTLLGCAVALLVHRFLLHVTGSILSNFQMALGA